MRRRRFLTRFGAAAASTLWPLAARAQQAMPVIGFLNGQSPNQFTHLVTAFGQGLNESGYVEGRNVAIEYRWAEGQVGRLPALAAELVRRHVAVIAATGGAPKAAKAATTTIPIVCSFGSDPVKEGLVVSLNRPGGNLTGVSVFAVELEAKRLELLHELVPKPASLGVILDSTFSAADAQLQELQAAARVLARQMLVVNVRTEADIDTAFARLRQARIGAISVGASPFNNSKRAQYVARAAQYAIPAIYENRETAMVGGMARVCQVRIGR